MAAVAEVPSAAKAKAKAKQAAPLLSLDPERQREFQAEVQRVKKGKADKQTPGVIYVGHLPRGLYEPQLREYFSQFGTVTRLRLSRSKKTGGSKGYAFVEFEYDEVAKIVADTMNNYLFGERILKCHFMPPEKVHPALFKGSEKKFTRPTYPAVKRYNRKRTAKESAKMTLRLLKKERQLRKRLAEKGIDYDFPGFAADISLAKKKKTSASDLNVSVNSEDPTPVCTPTFFERRKSQPEDSEDTEIILKSPSSTVKTGVQKMKARKLQKKAVGKKRKCKT
ncbi:MKI67 FHA domain-interacting nucleolar phosphoprotein [Anolis carolinensis]|uniref:RRM domain-containing protein n=1 Tax=Anolis carolinensis TaxID=28377 RepID=G1KD10_ANOCA|nr:PREDICTED: MKI67 FHA domain-interacting nucleolar phosphoprotein [Anolis carolinensis]|eukprot:XP_003218165.1 PREDICTED: MKI67 FHA domain-interacting nucleolar phosphoprotein [Anolis carolinensis]